MSYTKGKGKDVSVLHEILGPDVWVEMQSFTVHEGPYPVGCDTVLKTSQFLRNVNLITKLR
jgi:hypothetical protein